MRFHPEQRWAERWNELRQDFRYALRMMARTPGFTAVAVLTLALGIGANSAIFSVVNGVLLKPLPFPEPERLISVASVNLRADSRHERVSVKDFEDWRAQRKQIADMGAYFYMEAQGGTDFIGGGEPQNILATYVTPGFFGTLATPPQLGRLPRDDEMVRGANDKLVVLSHGFWVRQFGASPTVIGQRLALGGTSYEVVGVMPESFRFPSPKIAVIMSYSAISDDDIPHTREVRSLEVVARLKPGVTMQQAAAELDATARRLADQYPEDRDWGATTVSSLYDTLVGSVRKGLLVLFGAVGFVLLMASVNLASLLLARATARERELAVRAALGAGRARILRQLLTESIALAFIGGACGLIVAHFGTRALLHVAAGQLPRTDDVRVDAGVALFALGASLVTGLLFGLLPAIRASSPRLQGTLREGTRGNTDAGRLRGALVSAEMALAVILVIGAGLMTRTFVNLMRTDLGFQTENRIVVTFSISGVTHANDGMQHYYREILDRVRAVPGVLAVGGTKELPLLGNGETVQFVRPGAQAGTPGSAVTVGIHYISDGYFNAMGIPLTAGREYTAQDGPRSAPGFVVNEAYVKAFAQGKPPLAATVAIGRDKNGKPYQIPIIGVTRDYHQGAIDAPAIPALYVNAFVNGRSRVHLVVRTRDDPKLMIKRVQDVIHTIDRQQTFTRAFTMQDAVDESVARPRLLTVLMGLFGVMGLVLGALGIYGVLAYLVSQRTREIGVRIALGAQRGDVVRMIVGRGLWLAVIGVAVGVVGALLATRFMQGVLYGVGSNDPLTFGGVVVVLLVVAALASWIPARRASRVDPAVALRYD